MIPRERVYKLLEELDILYEEAIHPPVVTTQEADEFIVGIPGVRTKSLFLTNKKKNQFYLLITDDSKRLDMDHFAHQVDQKKIKFASEELLQSIMKLEPGQVSIFGLMNDTANKVKLFFDKDIMNESRMSFHPNDNTRTIFLTTEDLLSFILHLGYEYHVIEV